MSGSKRPLTAAADNLESDNGDGRPNQNKRTRSTRGGEKTQARMSPSVASSVETLSGDGVDVDTPPKQAKGKEPVRTQGGPASIPDNDETLQITKAVERVVAGGSPSNAAGDHNTNSSAFETGAQSGGEGVSTTASSSTTGEPSGSALQSDPDPIGPNDDADRWVEIDTKPYINDALRARLCRMLVYTREEEGIYALSRVPVKRLQWGTSESTLMRLCMAGTNKPVTVWIIGEIATLWLFDPKEGEPNAKISIGVTPLTSHALGVGRYILERRSHPVAPVDSWLGHLTASRWQSERLAGHKKAKVMPFEECYDAVKRYQSKDAMDALPPEDLKIGDIVLLEAEITRYPINRDTTTSRQMTAKARAKAKTQGPADWKVTFELTSVSLLFEIPMSVSRKVKSGGPRFTECF